MATLLTIAEYAASRRPPVSAKRIYKLISDGRLKPIQQDGLARIPSDATPAPSQKRRGRPPKKRRRKPIPA